VRVKSVIKIKLITVHRTVTYPVFWRQGVQNSAHSPNTKTQFVDVVLSVRKNVEAVLVSGGFITHHTQLIIHH